MTRPPYSRSTSAIVLRLALGIASPVLFCASPTQAQQLPAATSSQHYAIAAGPLNQVLTQFVAISGIYVGADGRLTAGIHSPGVHGQWNPTQALNQLLTGTRLQAQPQANGSYVLQATPEAAGTASLAEVRVSTSAWNKAVTEGTGSYTNTSANTATQLPLSMRETPQSVSVLTREQMDVQGISTLDEAVQNVTGLVSQKGYYAGESGQFSARGFTIDNLMLDGLPTSLGGNSTMNADNEDMAIYDRMEVVRGATGLTSGSGSPSAALNLVRKRPTASPQGALQASIGSWDNYRLQLDGSNALNEAKTLRGRAVATMQDKRNFYDTAHDRNGQLYGILEADLSADTTLSVGAHWRRIYNTGIYNSLPTQADGSFLDVPRSTNLGNAYDHWGQTSQSVFAELEQKLAGGWRAKLSATRRWQDLDMSFSGFSRINGSLYQNSQAYILQNNQSSLDLHASGPFELLGRSHEAAFGVSHRRLNYDSYGGWSDYAWTSNGPLVDPYNWNPYAVSQPAIDMSKWKLRFTTRETGIYGVARWQLADALKLITGLRADDYKRTNEQTDQRYTPGHQYTPYGGLIYDLNGNHTLYASWTRIFQPQTVYDRNGEVLDPITGTNLEAGIKGEYFDGRLNASLAVFQIRQRNRAVDDTSSPNPCPGSSWGYCQRASGEVESKGVEAEISGEIRPNWQVSAGYAYVSAKYRKDSDPSNIGELFDSDYPRHQFKMATTYRLPDQWQRWRVGGNVYIQNSTHVDDGAIHQDGYAIFGLHGGYQLTRDASIRLNIYNLFDKHYYQGLGWTTGGNQPGTPRSFMLTLDYRL